MLFTFLFIFVLGTQLLIYSTRHTPDGVIFSPWFHWLSCHLVVKSCKGFQLVIIHNVPSLEKLSFVSTLRKSQFLTLETTLGSKQNFLIGFSADVKNVGPTEIWTRIAGFRVQSANHYTIEPRVHRNRKHRFYSCTTRNLNLAVHFCNKCYVSLFTADTLTLADIVHWLIEL